MATGLGPFGINLTTSPLAFLEASHQARDAGKARGADSMLPRSSPDNNAQRTDKLPTVPLSMSLIFDRLCLAFLPVSRSLSRSLLLSVGRRGRQGNLTPTTN